MASSSSYSSCHDLSFLVEVVDETWTTGIATKPRFSSEEGVGPLLLAAKVGGLLSPHSTSSKRDIVLKAQRVPSKGDTADNLQKGDESEK